MEERHLNRLLIAFEQALPFPIWRLVFEQVNEAPGLLVAELRHGDSPTLSLAVITLPTGEMMLREAAIPFHSSLLGVWNGLALYHRFDNNQLPIPTAIGCLDLTTGQSRWEWPGHSLVAADAQAVWIRRTSLTHSSPNPPVVLRLTDGEPLEEPENVPVAHNSRLYFPVSYAETSSYWPIINRFLKKVVNQQAVHTVDYLERSDKILFSYYFHETNHTLRSSLLIIDRQQSQWLHLPLSSGSPVPPDGAESVESPLAGNNSFCVWQHQVIVLTSPYHIRSYYLNSIS